MNYIYNLHIVMFVNLNTKILLIGVPSDRVLSSFASFLKKHNYDMFFINLNLLADEVFFGDDYLLLHDKKIYYSKQITEMGRVIYSKDNNKLVNRKTIKKYINTNNTYAGYLWTTNIQLDNYVNYEIINLK